METSQPSSPQGVSPRVWRNPAVILATGLWLGRVPFAPGTVGALWGLPLAAQLLHLPEIWMQLLAMAVLFLAGVPVCDRAAKLLGRKDPGCVVLDEIVTVPLAFIGLPPEVVRYPAIWILGFVLHRLFDITKPPPARQLEQLPGGLGIMADDVAAGLYAFIAMQLIVRAAAGLHWL